MRPLFLVAAILSAGLTSGAGNVFAQSGAVATVAGKPITEADLKLAERDFGARLSVEPNERRRVLLEILIEREILAAEAKRIYDEQSAAAMPEEEVRVRDIVAESEAEAKAIRDRIVNGADLAALAETQSTDKRMANGGGDPGWRTRDEFPGKLASAIFALPGEGGVTAPVQTESGWHVLRLEGRRMRPIPPFAEVKDRIIRILVRDRRPELAGALRERARVVYLDPAHKPPAGAPAAKTDARIAHDASRRSPSVREVFEKHNLFGVFAWDCTRPASKDNGYFVNRSIDDSHVQRDFMINPLNREWSVIIDKAAESKPDEVAVTGTLNGQDAEALWRIEPHGMQQWHAKVAGKTIIDNGMAAATGRKMPFFNKCVADAGPGHAAIP